jgi:protocatechuate 3,4-dioxygenase beta subunit
VAQSRAAAGAAADHALGADGPDRGRAGTGRSARYAFRTVRPLLLAREEAPGRYVFDLRLRGEHETPFFDD